MKSYKFSSILLIASIIFFTPFYIPKEKAKSLEQEEEKIFIPPEAHKKAIQALKALGPTRGAKKIDYRIVKIIGVAPRRIESQSEKIQSTLKDLGAKETKTEVQIELSGDVLFDFDKWNIRPDAEETLKNVGEIIKAYKSPKVIIAGHTDSKGSEKYNQDLSTKRAKSVKNWLVDNTGINQKIMVTIGYGESQPAVPNTNPDGSDNPEGRQKNRRVEILIKKE